MRNFITADLFAAGRIISELNVKEELRAVCQKSDTIADVWAAGYDLIYLLFEKAVTKKNESLIYEFLAGVMEITPEEVARYDLLDLIEELTKGENAEKWKAFFTRLARLIKAQQKS